MPIIIWLAMSFTISIIQLLVITQPEWIVNGGHIQGLFAVCTPWSCELREFKSLLPLFLHFMGSLLFLISSLTLVPTIFCSSTAAPMQTIAHMQITAG
ncbi:hypothetical protein DICVIV_06059 [Dictyocaulus viviparus]|uniref:Uncharacterized protein n=1 Tax=Dictyocaulus viviparus TaxID=29172 RepID=A0A0D8XVQ9_DICVI|nr:hypothetical protein DICVIV_06059 [Dictyocaulus viviparus]